MGAPPLATTLAIITITLAIFSSCNAADKASFYGASYISYPLQESKSTTDLSFKFRTRLSNALLLLAVGKTDYCMIRLESGRLKLHINLGAGESEYSSPKGVLLNDTKWHHVTIIRREANLTIKIDDTVMKKRINGQYFELNIQFGVFLGGQGDFSELFLGHMENLRGCMEDVIYNGINIIEKARSRSGAVRVEGVTWNCAPEFDAGFNNDISFVEEGSYLVLPKINSRAGGRWQIELKTISSECMVLYNGGGSSKGSDFLSVEVLDGMIRVKMLRGSIMHTVRVNDGHWHKLHLLFNPSLIELSVDGVEMSTRVESSGARYLDLSDSFYVGGIDMEKRQKAFSKGVKATNFSIMGCIRGMEVDDKPLGLPSAVITKGVLPNCVWWYPCQATPANPPCVPHATCHQHGVDHFTCRCDASLCINPDYAEKYKVFSKLENQLELVALSPLVVQEGGVALITTQNIDVVLDHQKYGVRPSGILLHVVQPPEHGRIATDLALQRTSPQLSSNFGDIEGKTRQIFTLLDITRDKVRYVHDGSENHQDRLVLDMELAPEARFTLPSYLQGKNTFVLHINITPVNDAPVLNILPGKVLRLTQGTRKVITSEILKAEDPDTFPVDLLYSILHGKNEPISGHIEMSGQPVDSFTQQDIDSGLISYVHVSNNDKNLNKTSARLSLQVSDGIETSGPATLRIAIVPLQVRLVNNTGLTLVHKSYALIAPDNLTFATNSDDTSVEVRYDIVKPPQFGVVERLRILDGIWQTVDSFTSQMIAFGRLRYSHLVGQPSHDEFKFKASVGDIRTNTLYDFRITFIKLELYQGVNKELVLNNTREAFISSHNLKFETRPLSISSEKIQFTLIKPPKYGMLHLSSGKHHLQTHDVFTQHHIDTDQFWYRLHRRAYSHVQDEFYFIVSASECENVTGSLSIQHTPGPPTNDHQLSHIHTTLERLQVNEGSRMVIPSTHLNFKTDSITNLIYNITHMPRHGKIEVVDEFQKVVRLNATYFTSQELNSDLVYYCHDDSESRHDSFHFMALSPEPEDFQYVGVFHIDIILKNDNSPVRVTDGIFHIVHGGSRLITGRDLRYVDADIDTKPSDIIYTTRSIPNGGIYRADNPFEPLAQFSQEDIDKNRVLFKHQGEEYGKVALWISDGLYDSNGVLEIQASPPFIRMLPSNGSIVENGKTVLLTSNDLQVDTNMNCMEDDVRFEIISSPSKGMIEVGGAPGATTFTLFDVSSSRVAYKHREIGSALDDFKYKVTCENTFGESSFQIKIFPSSYWEPLKVFSNRPLVVEESTSVVITKTCLEVMHPQIEPSNIIYKVTDGPHFGWLEVISSQFLVESENIKDEPKPAKVFDQAIINAKRLSYVQSGVNQTHDKITFDVTNGIVWLKGVELSIIIVPEYLYMQAKNITVVEGNKFTFRSDSFQVLTDYYRGKVAEFRVENPPKYGKIWNGKMISKFSLKDVFSNFVEYIHDGSEINYDSFELVGITIGHKESVPFTVHVNIMGVNDEAPTLVANTGLCSWEGGTFVFTRKELHVIDADTPANNITFTVLEMSGGYIAMKNNTSVAHRYFTQGNIDRGEVVFVHTNGTKGKILFNISDGIHTLHKIVFLITTRPVQIKVVKKQNLNVFPLLRKPITKDILFSVASDPTREIRYELQTLPTLGRVVIDTGNNHHRSVKEFTQRDVNNSIVFYEHTHPFTELYTNDSFIFDVVASLAKPVKGVIFNVEISISSGGLTEIIPTTKLEVEEGGKVAVKLNLTSLVKFLENHAGLKQPLIETQLSSPRHGSLEPYLTSYTQTQLQSGMIMYQHDHSDTFNDSIKISVYLIPDYVFLCNISLPITIIPINDQPFKLVTDAPQISVVQGESHIISKKDLLTEDADTGPDDIVYDVISGPTQGRILILPDNKNRKDAVSVNKFTQSDINKGRILYEHSGLLQMTTFYFRVWDGKFKPTYTLFNIVILPVSLNISSEAPVYLQQGLNVVSLSKEQIHLVTNARRSKVVYNITRQPSHGMIYLGGNPTTTFSQTDLETGSVIYMQNDMTTSNDSFEVIASVPFMATSSSADVQIIVQPFMTLNILRVRAYDKSKITLNTLDATLLAKLTGSNPAYTIIQKPRYGEIKKIIRSSGEHRNAREREISYFTHEDVKSGVIYFVPKKVTGDVIDLEDSIRFVLAASIFQPANGEAKILIRGKSKDGLPGPNDPAGRGAVQDLPRSSLSSYYYLLIFVGVSIFIFITIVVVGLIKCRRNTSARKDQNMLEKIHGQTGQGGMPPMPLPRPPDHLMPSPIQGTPSIKRYISSDNSMHTGTNTPMPSVGSIPQCKVTPLRVVDAVPIPPGSAELNARYPYGAADDHTDTEEWSSYDASEAAYPIRATTTNPMLRRNQYWV